MANPLQKLDVGVVGLGQMGQRHALNVLHRIPRARLYTDTRGEVFAINLTC
jgi:6-phosphogluconate dehydrogenase